MKTKEKQIGVFLEELGSKSPAPGGGGAAGLAGAIGAELASMVCNLTIGKKKYAAHEAELRELAAVFAEAAERFTALADADEEAFVPLSKVYGMPRETEEEQRLRAEAMAKALTAACAVPLSVIELCAETITKMHVLLEIGTKLAVSDVGVAAKMLAASIDSALLNVAINVRDMADREEAKRLWQRAEELRGQGLREAEEIFDVVLRQLTAAKETN